MTVRELLERIDSRELAEWQAYEQLTGPLDDAYLAEALASLHEQMQTQNRMIGAAHFTDKKHKKNPAPEPKHFPRPHELCAEDSSDEEGDN
ncbi:hypothetical protein [Streptomyces sp. NPDC059009]|uniref:hypothetical protein n=1 Tax=Streptomyces sp. NPDC059009 TaxID=3346694 RepID=UPI003694B1BB